MSLRTSVWVALVGVLTAPAQGQHWFSAPVATDPVMRTQAAADMDGDGDLDLIRTTVDTSGSWTSGATWINDGSGRFLAGFGGPLPPGLIRLAVTGDFNGDGFQDVAVPTSATTPGTGAGILLIPGDGTGAFLPGVFTPLDGAVLAWSPADVDGDGDTDLAVANVVAATLQTRVRWLSASPAGTFAPQAGALFPAGTQVFDLALVDADQDGDPDVATVIGSAGIPQLAVSLTSGVGLPSALPTTVLPLPVTSAGLEPGDYLGNGSPQLVVAGRAGSDLHASVVTFPGGTSIASGPTQVLTLNLATDGFIHHGDWDGDGDDDLLLRALLVGPGTPESLLLLGNAGAGTFNLSWTVRFLRASDALASPGDFDGDGRLDLAGPLDLIFGDGTLAPPMPALPGASQYQRALDWEGDGDLDLVGTLPWVRLNDGAGGFTTLNLTLPLLGPNQSYNPAAVGDLTGDGYTNVFAPLIQQQLFMGGFTYIDNRLLAVGGGGIVQDLGSATPAPTQIALRPSVHFPPVDVDGDGDLDLLEAGQSYLPTTARPWLNSGTGFFTPAAQGYGSWVPVAAADLDGDGDMDAIGTSTTQVAALLQQPGGAWTQTVLATMVGVPQQPSLADFDDDGDPDVALISSPSSLGGQLHVLENVGGGSFILHVLPAYGIYGSGSRVLDADVDGDGRTDFVLSGSSAGPSCITCQFIVVRRLGPGFSSLDSPVRFRGPEPWNAFDADGDGDEDLFGTLQVASRRYVGPAAGLRRQFGAGTPGTAGFVPVLGAAGPFRPGSGIEIRLARALAGAPCLVALGTSTSAVPNSPLPGLTSFCAPWAASLPLVLAPATPAPGNGRLLLPAQLGPALAGTAACLQVGVADPVAVSGVAISNGLEIIVGL